MTKIGFYIGLNICFISLYSSAQISVNAIPFSISDDLPDLENFIEMNSFDMGTFVAANAVSDAGELKQYRFANPLPVNLYPENSGEWFTTRQGSVWRLGIRSAGAYSLYVTFNAFRLDKGVRLFVYTPGLKEIRGAFTSRNNNPHNILSVSPLPGDAIIIELNISGDSRRYGMLNISTVYHDCLNQFGRPGDTKLKVSDGNTCSENINCENGKYWQTEKKAVCKIISDGISYTGTLIGNTTGSDVPYILTANHAIFDSIRATQSIFYFNYELPSCSSNLINKGQTLSGATLVATTDKLDFSLLRLNDIPPVSYNPYYAGWDAGYDTPQGGICIHHPWGNEKQIALEYHSLSTGSIGFNYDTLSSWRVARWEIGTTESGSSGAPLFNKQHRLVGNLSGGQATCENPVDDYFNKFCLSWNTYPHPANQLRYWLDPMQTGQTFLDGYDPFGFSMSDCDTAWNTPLYKNSVLSSSGLSWGCLSGHNSAGYSQFAEKFSSWSSIHIPGVFLKVAKTFSSGPLSNVAVKVWEGNSIPENEVYSGLVFLENLNPNTVNYVAFDSVVKVTGDFYIGYEINYSIPSDTFAVFHTENDFNRGPSTMYIYDGNWRNLNSVSSANLSASMFIGIVECYGSVRRPGINEISVYPNPCSRYLYLDIPQEETIYSIECYDAAGRPVPTGLIFSEEIYRIEFDLESGIYLLKIKTGNHQLFAKFLVVRYE